MRFRDRRAAGRQLADQVRGLGVVEPVVLGLPRGGVPVAWEVARSLGAPLDVVVARKVAMPGQEELGIGAVAEGGASVRHAEAVALGLGEATWAAGEAAARAELDRRVARYRGGRPLAGLVTGRDVVVVDDGLATGVTAEAAVRAVRAMGAVRVVLAAPVCAPSSATRLEAVADDVVCVARPHDFLAVGRWYHDFRQTTDDEVLDLLAHPPTS